MIFLISIIVIILIGVFLILPISKKIRKKHSTGLDYLLGAFLLIAGIYLAQKYSDSLNQEEEKTKVISTINRAILESNDVLQIVEGRAANISKIKEPKAYYLIMKNNPLPSVVIFESFDKNPLIINNISDNTFQMFTRSKKNLNTLRNWSHDDELGIAGMNKLIYGYLHEIDNVISCLNLELKYMNEEFDEETHMELLKILSINLMSKNAKIAQKYIGTDLKDFTYKKIDEETLESVE